MLDEILQQQLQRHGLGDEIDLHDNLPDMLGPRKETLRIDVSDDIVDVAAPDENP